MTEQTWNGGGHDPFAAEARARAEEQARKDREREREEAQRNEQAEAQQEAEDEGDSEWMAHYGNDVALDDTIDEAAFHGPIGEFAGAMGGTHTLASAPALLLTGLVRFSGELGRGPYSADRHSGALTRPQLFGLEVGTTGAGKGVSIAVWDRVYEALPKAAHDPTRIVTDLNSGEGLVPLLARLPVETDGSTLATVLLEEFATVLRAKSREGATLGQYIRRAYDGRPLQRNTANGGKAGLTVNRPAIAMLAQVTPQELHHEATVLDAASGFLNRFIVFPVVRVKDAEPTSPDESLFTDTADRLATAIGKARSFAGPVVADKEAERLLDAVARWQRTAASHGLVGSMLERVSQSVARLALVYSLSRCEEATVTPTIAVEDVRAALAVMATSERTVRAMWAGRPRNARWASILARVRRGGEKGATVFAVEHRTTYAYRDRLRQDVADMLDEGLLVKVPAGRGFRLKEASAPGVRGLSDLLRDADVSRGNRGKTHAYQGQYLQSRTSDTEPVSDVARVKETTLLSTKPAPIAPTTMGRADTTDISATESDLDADDDDPLDLLDAVYDTLDTESFDPGSAGDVEAGTPPWCRDYQAHRGDAHRRVGAAWRCLICSEGSRS